MTEHNDAMRVDPEGATAPPALLAAIRNMLDELISGSDWPIGRPQTKPLWTYGTFAKQLLTERRNRSDVLGNDLLGEPAWDIVLDLMVARELGTRISVSSLCIAASVPPTTAFRCIDNMVQQGLLWRQDDDEDKRRVFIGLSDKTRRALMDYLAKTAAGRGLMLSDPLRRLGAR
jgi:DNA-binding MarR family transcriptional regulator